MLRLAEATEAHWDWLCGHRDKPNDLFLPEGGVDDLPTLDYLRRVSRELRSARCPHSYLILHGNEVAGLCGYKHPPDTRSVEIGFGIAAARRNRGYATDAVRLLLEKAETDASVDTVRAETHVDNLASQAVLQRNGFAQCGMRHDSREGDLILWRATIRIDGAEK